MRVLFLTTGMGGVGGVQYAGRLLARAIRDGLGPGTDLTVLSLGDSAVALDRLHPDCTGAAAAGNRLRTVWDSLRLSRRHWDLVLLGHVNLAPLTLLFRPRRPPVLTVIYGIEGWRPLRGLTRLGLRRTTRLFYISRHTQARTELANPWLRHFPAFVCHLGLLPSGQGSGVRGQGSGVRGQGPEEEELLSPDPFALGIGRMSSHERYKGHEELIRIWPRVRRERPGLRLVFIGDGDDRPRLQGLAGEHPDGIEFLGAADDATRDRYLRRCRSFCLPARGEGLGLVYLEAMRLGKPVLAGDKDAGREVVVDGATGRTVDPLAPEELLRGVLDVTGPRADEMGAAGRRRFADHFDYPAFLGRFCRHLHEMLPRRGAALATRGAGCR